MASRSSIVFPMNSLRLFLLFGLLSVAGVLRAESFTGLNVSAPLAFSGSLGWRFGDPAGASASSVELEAGVGGYKVMAGLHQQQQAIPTAIKVAYLYTWFEPIDVETEQSYVGLEVEASFGSLIGTLGGYRRVDGDEDPWVASFGIGLRF